MLKRRHTLTLASAAFFAFVSTASTAVAQQRPLTKDEEREAKAVTSALGDAFAGKAVGNDLGLKFVRTDALQAQADKSIMAFGLNVDPAKVPSGKVFLIWRAMPPGADPKDKKVQPIFENFSTATLDPANPFIGRLFLAPAGKIDLLIGAHELQQRTMGDAPRGPEFLPRRLVRSVAL